MNVTLKNEPSLDDVLGCFRDLANKSKIRGKFAVNEDPNLFEIGRLLVSSAIINRPESSIVDVEYCSKQAPMYTFLCWYGNEWIYVWRLIEALHEQCP
ncbi:hypothetical protein KKF55_03570 [Patescibacteria group bacterium]|nr:hypothetical protein [Patescibacteria group bacterium]